MVVGRDRELGLLTSFVVSTETWPAVGLLQGEPGIGKSTLWDSAVAVARGRGHRLLVCRPAPSDARLSFTGLGDLLDRLPEASFASLPPPQREALDAALLRTTLDTPVPGWRAVSMGMVGVLRSAAEGEPVLIAIDDLQWLDPSTLRVLTFAVRRLGGSRVGLLLASRSPEGTAAAGELVSTLDESSVVHVSLGPLPVDALARILRDRMGQGLDRADVRRIHEQARGNPFYALEFARAVLAREPQATGRTIPVPRSLVEDFMRHRLAALSEDAHETMLAVASTSRPTPKLLREAVPDHDVDAGLEEARRAEVLFIADGVVAFTHPLFGSAIYEDTSRSHRQRVHARLAKLVDDVEERARHLALSSDGPDPLVAVELERAASLSLARGAPDATVSLLTLAIRETPPDDVASLVRQHTSLGTARFQIGDTDGAIGSTTAAVRAARPGGERAEALSALGRLYAHVGALGEARAALEEALAEPDLHPDTLASIHADLFWTFHNLGAFDDSRRHAAEALRLRTDSEAGVHIGQGLVDVSRGLRLEIPTDPMGGRVAHREWAEEPPDHPMREWPALKSAEEFLYTGRHDEARDALDALLATSEARGDESGRALILSLLAELDRRSGNLVSAEARARAAIELVEQLGYNPATEVALLGSILALVGRTEEARARFAQADRLGASSSSMARLLTCAHAGAMELSLHNPPEAHDALTRATQILFDARIGEPGAFLTVHDAAEAAIAVGDLDTAERLTGWLEERGNALDRPYALATGARCRGALWEARGDRAAALTHLRMALTEHERLDMPLELGRTYLAMGGVMRRDGQKRAARVSLEAAVSIFEDIGAETWAERVHDEMGHIAGRRPAPGKLTDAEDRVARLAVAGLRNREIADTLVMSVRTVESHLSHAYAKLGVRSRTELTIFYDDPASEVERALDR